MRVRRANSLRVLLAVTTLAWTAAPAAWALPVPFAVSISAGETSLGLEDLSVGFTPNGEKGGTYTLLLDEDLGVGVLQDWSSMYNMDPFVTNNFVIQNNTLSTQTYVVTVTSPVSPALSSTLMLGSVGLTLTNTTGTASLTNVPTNAVYTALIDGSSVATLFGDPYILSEPSAFGSETDSTDFGIPVAVAGPAVTSDIGIRIEFALSPGDSAGVTSVFYVELPEPASLALLAVGGLGLVLVRLRRAS